MSEEDKSKNKLIELKSKVEDIRSKVDEMCFEIKQLERCLEERKREDGIFDKRIEEKEERIKKLEMKTVSIEERVFSLSTKVETKVDGLRDSVEVKVEALRQGIEVRVDALRQGIEIKVEALKTSVEKSIAPLSEAIQELKSFRSKFTFMLIGTFASSLFSLLLMVVMAILNYLL